ncbi:hypothetical protein [Gimesia aquarii]|uniref:Leucine Rich repeats (2 copies) n=1 Tax=Gimesia aquarii TaxID=2527964 RepID=A0A517VTT5_9PLAN|nr:hypothetical protein [Gimesia aquarii]QDT96415.1 hypothetical protein V144x_18700 [Gimesia aquarii]
MKPKMMILGVFFSLVTVFAIVVIVKSKSQPAAIEKKQRQAALASKKKGKPNFLGLGLRVGLDKTGEILRVTGKDTVRGQSVIQTSRTSKEVFEWIVTQEPQKLHFEIVYMNEDDTALLKQLPDLEEITFINTNVGERTIQHLSKIKSLKRISIQNGNITDQSIFIFAQMPGLEFLTLERNRFLPMAVGRLLRKLLPEAKVEVT